MTLILHEHPLSSFCWKVKIALCETGVPFETRMANPGSEDGRAALAALWPIGKIPVLEDTARGRMIPETSVIVEYIQTFHARSAGLIPSDPDAMIRARLLDRVFDNYLNMQVGRIVAENFRGGDDPVGVAEADRIMIRAYTYLESELAGRSWAAGDDFTIADCAAAPALFYADKVLPFRESYPTLAAYYDRLEPRASFIRAVEEAQPFMQFFPGRKAA